MGDFSEDFLDQMLADEEAMANEMAEVDDFGFDPDGFDFNTPAASSTKPPAAAVAASTATVIGPAGERMLSSGEDSPATVAPPASARSPMVDLGGISRRLVDGGEVSMDEAWGEGSAEGSAESFAAAAEGKRKELLAVRLGQEGLRNLKDRAMDRLPGKARDDWRDGGDDCEGEEETSGRFGGKINKGGGKARGGGQRAASLRRKLTGKSSGEEGSKGSAACAFGLDNQVFATASSRLHPPICLAAKKHLLDRPPMEGLCMTVVTGNGNRYYLKRSLPHIGPRSASALLYSTRRDGGLLPQPMSALMKQVEKKRFARMMTQETITRTSRSTTTAAAANKASDTKEGGKEEREEEEVEKKDEDEMDEDDDEGKSPLGKTKATRKGKEVEIIQQAHPDQLWVNRFSPSAFPHLLSDEAINREVLRMVRSWDEYVFKRALSKSFTEPTQQVLHTFKCLQGQSKWKTGWQPKGSFQQQQQKGEGKDGQLEDGGDGGKRDKRPQVRAILLCGPPGMGKTTLAHVVANHCGYRPFEINASDDRSAPVLKEKITRAMQNQAVLGDKRPNCIILDEADGIDGQTTMKMIVDMIKAPLSQNQQGKKTNKSGEASVPPLTRPLICVCNDLYAPQLRALRDVAAVFRFRKTSSTRLLQRLKTICSAESLPLESTALGALCEASGNDIRCCLNTLQFFKSKLPVIASAISSGGGNDAALSSALSRQLVLYIGAGLKDQEKDMLQVCNVIFRKPQLKHTTTAAITPVLLPGEEPEAIDNKKKRQAVVRRDTDDVIKAVACFSDHQSILQAVHENFLSLSFTDPNLTKTALATEWMAFSDLIQGRQREGQQYLMEDLHLATSAAMHLLCRIELRPRIQMPKRDYEFRSNRTSRQHIIQSFMEGCSIHAIWARNVGAIIQDVVSPLMDILNPSLRAINPELYTFAEKAALKHLVQVMMGCGISFVQSVQGAIQGGQQLEMVPALEHLAVFGEQDPRPRVRVLPNFVKLLATQEAKLEAMKRAEKRKMEQEGKKDGSNGSSNASALSSPKATGTGSLFGAAAGTNKRPKADARSNTSSPPKKAKIAVEEEEESLPKGPKNWFVKLGTKRSSRPRNPDALLLFPSSAAAAAATKKGPSSESAEGQEDGKEHEVKPAIVRFKYQAGFTNAIRRPVYMKDML